MKAALILLAVGCAAANTLKFSKDVVINGGAEGKTEEDGVIQFRVSTTDKDGQEWTCLRVEFNLEIQLDTSNSTSDSTFITNTTTINDTSNCSQLVLNLNNSTSSLIDLQFEQQQSEKETEDVQIFFMKKVSLTEIPIPSFETPINADFEFIPEGPVSLDFTNETTPAQTPVELEIHNSFKCYRGFEMTGNTTDENHVEQKTTVVLGFTKFKLEMYASFDKKATDMNMKSPWKRIMSCDADISKVLPVIVGGTLAAIVIFTLAGYIIAKKRSSHAYEELWSSLIK